MKSKKFLFTSESVTEGHPDKVCDQISDAILDEFLTKYPQSRVAAETSVTTGMVLVSGEITSDCYVDIPSVVRNTIKDIGYVGESSGGFDADTCAVLTSIDEQSTDIAGGVNKALESRNDNADVSANETESIGAGDQGIMFGYACDENDEYMPLTIYYAHLLARQLTKVRRQHPDLLKPDGKTQVSVEYENDEIKRIDTIVVSTQHSKDITQEEIKELIMNEVIKPCIDEKYLDENTKYFINPSGSFVVGGSWGDSGTTGRKIVCDTYGGRGRIGGGCFSSKDPTKVDRSAAYYSRYVAKNIVANGLARRCEVEVAYAIGKAQPVSLCVDTFGTGKFDDEKLLEIVKKNFNFEVGNIISELDLRKPIYHKTSCYGHFGDPQFTWEKVKKLEY